MSDDSTRAVLLGMVINKINSLNLSAAQTKGVFSGLLLAQLSLVQQ